MFLQNRHRLAALLTSVAFVAAPGVVVAQEVINLDTVVVEGDGTANGSGEGTAAAEALAATGPVDGYVATQTTTGSKSTTPIIEIPQSISVVTSQQLEDRAVRNLGQAVGYTAGVIAEPFGNDTRFFNPIIRGFDSNDSVYLNSFRFIRDFGAIAFEPYGLERVEILRGPASVLYGQGEPGGIINLISKRPTFTEFGEVGASIGSDNRYEARFDVGGVHNEALSYRFTGLGRLSEGQQDFTGDDRIYLAPTVTYALDADTSITFLGNFQYDAGESPLGVPQAGSLDFNPNGRVPRNRYVGEPGFNDAEGYFGSIGYELRHRIDERFEFRQNVQYLAYDADFKNLYFFGLGADQRTVTRGPNVQSEETDSFGVDNQLETKFETGILEHTAVIGLDYRMNDQFRSSNFSGPLTTIDVFNPVYGTPISVDPAGASLTQTQLTQTGLYAQDQIKIDRLSLALGLRQDFVSIDERFTGGETDDHALTGRVGATYLFDSGFAPFASYATSFNPQPGVNDVTGEVFDASEGEQYEVGVKFQPQGWNSFVTASVFDLTKTNVTAQQINPAGGSITTQTGEINSRGFELEATASLIEGLDLIGAYSYTDAEITRGDVTATSSTTGNRPANIPEHAASLWLNYAFAEATALEGLSLGAGVRYIGSRFGENANTIELPSATVVDAAIRFEKDSFNAALNVNNIADERYVASCNFGCFFGDGRTVIGSVGYKW